MLKLIKDLLESFQAPMERSTILLTTSTYTYGKYIIGD